MRERLKCEYVFLDAGMTLVHPVPHFIDGIRHVLEENGVETSGIDVEQHAAEATAFINSEINSGRRYAVSDEADAEFWGDVYEKLVAGLGYNGGSRRLGMKIYELYQTPFSFDLYADAKPALETLADMGLKLGIISNFSTILHGVFDRIGISGMFDTFIVSASEGCMKPDREIFELALKRANAAPGFSIMVGDNPVDDVAGSISAGMTPVLIDRHEKHDGASGHVIKSLAELPDLLEPVR